MGHSCQAVSLLVNASQSLFAVPLDIKIHEGLVFSNRSKLTLLDKMINLLDQLDVPEPAYMVGDAYYANGKSVKGALKSGNHLITRVKSNAVAFHPAPKAKKPKRGRPRLYGIKVTLKNLFRSSMKIHRIESPVYDEKNIILEVRTIDLLWRPAGTFVRFVLVDHPTRGRFMLMSTDLTLEPIEIIRLYGLRFKIELGFKQASQVIGAYDYHFWMMDMKPTKRHGGNQYLHHESQTYRDQVRRKMHCYHVYLFMGVVAQGLMQYLSACHTQIVWRSFGSWLRTLRDGVPPSERVVMMSLRNTLPHFLLANVTTHNLAKFIIPRQDVEKYEVLGMAA